MEKVVKKTIKASPKKLRLSVPTRTKKSEGYESDFYKWVNDQAKHLKKREFSKLDMDHLIEEIESLGRSEKRTLTSYLEVLLMHMLKIKYQPNLKSKSWDVSIKESRHKAHKTLAENPSLKPKLKEIVADAYFSARLKASLETGLEEKTFPEECLWDLKTIFPDLEKKYC